MTTKHSANDPLPMVKDATVKDDGRFLIYYSFPSEPVNEKDQNDLTHTTEDADV